MDTETEFELRVDGMTCEHCERAITKELMLVDGITRVRVDVPTGGVWVATDGRVPSEDAILEAVTEADFELVSGPTRAA